MAGAARRSAWISVRDTRSQDAFPRGTIRRSAGGVPEGNGDEGGTETSRVCSCGNGDIMSSRIYGDG